jgi:hypothetical protein
MNNDQKAQLYSNLTYSFDKLANEIASIKGESIDLNSNQLLKIKQLQEEQGRIISYNRLCLKK